MSLVKFTCSVLAICIALISLMSVAEAAQDEKKAAEKSAETKSDDTKTDDSKADAKTEDKKDDSQPAGDDKKDEGTAKGDSGDSSTDDPKTFDELNAEWTKIDEEFKKLAEDFNNETDDEKKKEIRDKYVALVAKATPVAESLRESAIKEYEKSPNENETVTKLLIGVIVDHIAFERRDDAVELGQKMIDAGVDESLLAAMRDSDRLSLPDLKVVDEIITRSAEAKADDLPRVKIETTKGDVVIELFENEAPGSVGNFISLVEKGFYDGVTFHRVIDEFVAQGGDPDGNGTGGPGYTIKDEQNEPGARGHYRGCVSMAHSNRPGRTDTGGSQFFICYTESETRGLNGKHTVFGRVVSGMENVDKFIRRSPDSKLGPDEGDNKIVPDKMIKATVIRKREHEYKPVKSGTDEQDE